jgi:polyisoprenoid-binding protein YceI
MRKLSFTILAAALAATALAAPAFANEQGKGKAKAKAEAAAVADAKAAPSGEYRTDPTHRHILFSYDHQGYSVSWIRWREWTGELNWNAEAPEKSSVKVTIDAAKVDSGVDVFDEHLRGEKFFDTAKYPTITFVSTSNKSLGKNKGQMSGDLTIKGVTKPVTLDVTLNKAAFEQRGGAYKVGFSGKTRIKRSDFGLDVAVPFVGDLVTLTVEAEFMGPMVNVPAQ